MGWFRCGVSVAHCLERRSANRKAMGSIPIRANSFLLVRFSPPYRVSVDSLFHSDSRVVIFEAHYHEPWWELWLNRQLARVHGPLKKKTVNRGRMAVEEEAIVVAAVVTVKENWNASAALVRWGQDRPWTASSRWFFSSLGSKRTFSLHFGSLIQSISERTELQHRDEDCHNGSKLRKTLKSAEKLVLLEVFCPQFYAWQWRMWVFYSLFFHGKTHETLVAEVCESVLSLLRNL